MRSAQSGAGCSADASAKASPGKVESGNNSNGLRANMHKLSRDIEHCQLLYEYSKRYIQGEMP
jgi:hypothetical protein